MPNFNIYVANEAKSKSYKNNAIQAKENLLTDEDNILDHIKGEINLRSLKGENNIVTESLKVVHQKFSPKKRSVLKSKDKLYKLTQKVKV